MTMFNPNDISSAGLTLEQLRAKTGMIHLIEHLYKQNPDNVKFMYGMKVSDFNALLNRLAEQAYPNT